MTKWEYKTYSKKSIIYVFGVRVNELMNANTIDNINLNDSRPIYL